MITVVIDEVVEAESLEDLQRQLFELASAAWEIELGLIERSAERSMAYELGLLERPDPTATEKMWEQHLRGELEKPVPKLLQMMREKGGWPR